MKKRIFHIFVICIFLYTPGVWGQKQAFSFSGQVNGWSAYNFIKPVRSQWGMRFIPTLTGGRTWKNNLRLDGELTLNAFGTVDYTSAMQSGDDGRIKPYRAYLRLSADRFEVRAGLQKINFGSATLLRPLMWFDKMDPRDPLQITDGVYALLGRYYFQNNANAWFWFLYGNPSTKGWEAVSTAAKKPEWGGRIQLPVPKGELAVSFHHRTPDLKSLAGIPAVSGSGLYAEDRLGLDGKWDIGPGVWVECSLVHSALDSAYFPAWTKLIDIGMDYTFGLGNGLTASSEYFRAGSSAALMRSGNGKNFSTLSASYPVGLLYRLSCIVFYDWSDKAWYRFLSLQRQTDNWNIYLMGFINPDQLSLYQSPSGNTLFAGKGMEIMLVFNF